MMSFILGTLHSYTPVNVVASAAETVSKTGSATKEKQLSDIKNMFYIPSNTEPDLQKLSNTLLALISLKDKEKPTEVQIRKQEDQANVVYTHIEYSLNELTSKLSNIPDSQQYLTLKILLARVKIIHSILLATLEKPYITSDMVSSAMHFAYTIAIHTKPVTTQSFDMIYTERNASLGIAKQALIISILAPNKEPRMFFVDNKREQACWVCNILNSVFNHLPLECPDTFLQFTIYKVMKTMEILKTTYTLTSEITSFSMHFISTVSTIIPNISELIIYDIDNDDNDS